MLKDHNTHPAEVPSEGCKHYEIGCAPGLHVIEAHMPSQVGGDRDNRRSRTTMEQNNCQSACSTWCARNLSRAFRIFLATFLTCWPTVGHSQVTQTQARWEVDGPTSWNPIEEWYDAKSPKVPVHTSTPESEKHPEIVSGMVYRCKNTPAHDGHFYESVSFSFSDARPQSDFMNPQGLKIRARWSGITRVDVFPASYADRHSDWRHIKLGGSFFRNSDFGLPKESRDKNREEDRRHVSRFLNRVSTSSWVLIQLGFPEPENSSESRDFDLFYAPLYFRYSLAGAKEAINNARISCGGEAI